MTIDKAVNLYENAKNNGKFSRRRKLKGYLPFRGGFILFPVSDAIQIIGDCVYYVSADGKIGEIPLAAVISSINFDEMKQF